MSPRQMERIIAGLYITLFAVLLLWMILILTGLDKVRIHI